MPEMSGAEARKRLATLRSAYSAAAQNTSFNLLLLGDYGTGKTSSLRTCRMPLLIHSFDPGGTKTIRDLIISDENPKGCVLADTRFELDDPKQKGGCNAFSLWEDTVDALRRDRAFDLLGTYCIDSGTFWFDALIRAVKRKLNLEQLRIQDWGTLFETAKDWVQTLSGLPCDFIMTGHIAIDRDELVGKNETKFGIPGQTANKLPTYFDEVYVARTKATSNGVEYMFLTRNDGYYKARTRLGANGRFNTTEPQDIKALLRKAGLSADDKPPLWEATDNATTVP